MYLDKKKKCYLFFETDRLERGVYNQPVAWESKLDYGFVSQVLDEMPH